MTPPPRRTRPTTLDERATLVSFLEHERDTLAWKCSGLTDDQLRLRAVPPSTMSLLGLVRHLTDVDRGWFSGVLGGEDRPPQYWDAETRQETDFDVDTADIAAAMRLWQKECERSRRILTGCVSLDTTGVSTHTGVTYSARWVLNHMIEEYARHNGHADLLRECVDGATGY
ncbi:DinB family protein [Nocardia stercoris]|uniref:DinB family protein n=1 Tax=Nocardia stercoris TaxID=2483361 RepID=A0A3M2KZZ5_9NOCA|nr:DinB family protein [Nocardia stercoris]RMI27878.1 DinB family protein [Nocardia stercoris]